MIRGNDPITTRSRSSCSSRPIVIAAVTLIVSATITNHANPDETPSQPVPEASSQSSALQAWQQLRALPDGRIDDTLGFMIDESADMKRLAAQLEALTSDPSVAPTDPRLALALLRCWYFSTSIDGVAPDGLLNAVNRALDQDSAPYVRAEAAHRLQIADLSRIAAQREWSAPLLPAEVDRLTAFLACYGASPRAIASIKRLVENAKRLDRPGDLDVCRDWVSVSVNRHPFARSIDGDRRALAAVGAPWTPALTTTAGAPIDWDAYHGAPLVVVFVGAGQSPSQAVLSQLFEGLCAGGAAPFRLVVVSVRIQQDDEHSSADPGIVEFDSVELNRGWREPVLVEYGIRALPTTFVLDGAGVLRRIICPTDWRTADRVMEAVAALSEFPQAHPPSTMPTTKPATNPGTE